MLSTTNKPQGRVEVMGLRTNTVVCFRGQQNDIIQPKNQDCNPKVQHHWYLIVTRSVYLLFPGSVPPRSISLVVKCDRFRMCFYNKLCQHFSSHTPEMHFQSVSAFMTTIVTIPGDLYKSLNFLLCNALHRSRGSSGSIVNDYGLDDRGSIPDRGRGFFF
jgi:hypothetical protein